MSISSASLSSPALSSASLRISASISHWINSRRRSSRNLGSVIAALRTALKQYDRALEAQKRAAEVIKLWGELLPDEGFRQLIDKIYVSSSMIWSVDPTTTVKVRTLLAKLQALRDEEEVRDRAVKEFEHAENAYYKALYKHYPTEEIENLQRAARTLNIKSHTAKTNYRNSMVLTLAECFESMFENLCTSSDATKAYAQTILSMIAELDTSAKEDLSDSDYELVCDSEDGPNFLKECGSSSNQSRRSKKYYEADADADTDDNVNEADGNKENVHLLDSQLQFSTQKGYTHFMSRYPAHLDYNPKSSSNIDSNTEETVFTKNDESVNVASSTSSSVSNFPQQSVKPLITSVMKLQQEYQMDAELKAFNSMFDNASEGTF